MGEEMSDHYRQLDSSARKRYKQKMSMLGLSQDPYLFTPGSADKTSLPSVEYPEIFNYLINLPSPYTKESLKAYKSSEAWSYFVAGFVSEIEWHSNDTAVLVESKVNHY